MRGCQTGYDDVELRGDLGSSRFAVFYIGEGRLLATDAVNSPQEFIISKKLIASRSTVYPDALSDISISMKAIASNL
ncbi:MAG: oxidoreductase C-terminal domain-containing protein [Pseudomonadales bacterium]